MEESNGVKKQRLDECGTSAVTATSSSSSGGSRNNFVVTAQYPRANDAIRVYIRSPFSPTLQQGGNPWFTHQVFPDERLALSSTDFPENSFINLTIDAQSLAFYVDIHLSADVSEESKQTVVEYLQKHMYPVAMPDSTDVSSHFQVSCPSSIRANTVYPSSTPLSPIGTLLLTSVGPGPTSFAVHLTSHRQDPDTAAVLLANLEKLAMWYIETASSVDFTESKWEMLVLYEVDSAATYSVAGYLTLYTFHNPFLGAKIRICQALVFPHYQKQGLGRILLRAAYQLALDRGHVVEITVEDPCEAFQNLRDQIDLELYLEKFPALQASPSPSLPVSSTTNVTSEEAKEKPASFSGFVFKPVNSNAGTSSSKAITSNNSDQPSADDISKALKLIPQQAHFVHEANAFFRLLSASLRTQSEASSALKGLLQQKYGAKTAQSKAPLLDEERVVIEDALHESSTEAFKSFRLQVKRTLLKFDSEGIKDLPKPDMQKALSELFDERVDRYFRLWSVVQRLRVLSG